jgi:hypothetical protein
VRGGGRIDLRDLRRGQVLNGLADDDSVSSVRVKFRVETPAPRSFAHTDDALLEPRTTSADLFNSLLVQ